jgi:group I intron endonuclease
MYLYKIENKINKKQYVGITNDIKRRWREHKRELKGNRHGNIKLQNAWNKYGEENFVFKKIQDFNTLQEMNKAEVEYIKKYNLLSNKNGYNLQEGGNSFRHTKEAKEKISRSNEVSVVSKCLKTGELKIYNRIKDVKKDGLNPKSISNACTGKNLTYKNKVWVYKSDYNIIFKKYYKYKNRNVKVRPKNYKKVYGMCMITKEIREYSAVDHVERDGFTNQAVRKCCKKNTPNKTHKNWVWSFKKEDLEKKYSVALNKITHKVL